MRFSKSLISGSLHTIAKEVLNFGKGQHFCYGLSLYSASFTADENFVNMGNALWTEISNLS